MGTHPIFESDFDCLTDILKYGRIQVHERNLAQEAIGNDALLATGPCLAISQLERDPPCLEANSPREGPSSWLQGYPGFCCLQNPHSSRWSQEARVQGCHHGQARPPGCLRAIRPSSPICCRGACWPSLRCAPRPQLILGWRGLHLQVDRWLNPRIVEAPQHHRLATIPINNWLTSTVLRFLIKGGVAQKKKKKKKKKS